MNPKIKELSKAIRKVSHSCHSYEVFEDFIQLAATQISNSVDPVHFESRHVAALETQKKYSDDENRRMCEAFEMLCGIINENLLCGEFEDILGRIFEELRIKVKGQDFTPDCISRLAAAMIFPEKMILPECGYITLSEPACGSGAMILAAAARLISSGISCFEQCVVFAADIEIRAVHMAYLQLALNGIPAVVVHGNILTCQEYDCWYTPMYINRKWVWRKPLGFTCGRNKDDELLKLMTEPV